jgi:ActR/RegA family two-component response regulator
MAGDILLLDDDDDLLDSLSELIDVVCSRECMRARSMVELVAARESALASSLAILDVNLGPGKPSGLDAYRWLRSQGYRGRIVFLTGHARSHPLVEEAYRLDDARVLSKPLDADELVELVGNGRG